MNNPKAEKSKYRAFIYIRVSSDHPSTEYALDAQRVECQRIAEKLDWTAVDVFTEPGQATTSTARSRSTPQMQPARHRSQRKVQHDVA